MATNLTLKEEKFHNLLKSVDRHDIVESLPLPGLVQFAEGMEFREEKVLPYLTKELSAFDLNQYGTIVLGCTHFPYFTNIFKGLFPEGVDVISGSSGTAKNLKRILEAKNQINDGAGEIIFFKSGHQVEDEDTLSQYRQLLDILNSV